MTTAELRKAALEAERRLDRIEAARHWDAAADAYPVSGMSALAARDIAMMRERAEDNRLFVPKGASRP